MNKGMNNITDIIIPDAQRQTSYHMIMLFYRPTDLGIPKEIAGENTFINTRNVCFENVRDALHYFANTPCPASQHIRANSIKELEKKKSQMIRNYSNPIWLQNNLYPYL